MMTYLFRIAFFLLSIAFVSSCETAKKESEYIHSEKDYVAFAKLLEESIKAGNGIVLDTAFDKEVFLERIKKGKSGDKELNKSAMAGFSSTIDRDLVLGKRIVESMKAGGYYSYKKFYKKGKVPHLVFRLFSEEGLNYHDFELVEHNGIIKIADCNVLTMGDDLSKIMRDLTLSTISSKEIMGVTIDEKVDEEYLDGIKKLGEVKELMSQKKLQEAMNKFEAIPEKVRQQKIFRIVELTIAMDLDEQKYLQLLNAFEKSYPDDVSLKLVMIDAYFLRKDYPNALKAINVLEKRYGRDGVLDFYKANLYYAMSEYDKANEMYKSSTTTYGDFEDAYTSWLTSLIEGKNYSEAIRISKILIQDFNYTVADLETFFQSYPDFLNSGEYKNNWN